MAGGLVDQLNIVEKLVALLGAVGLAYTTFTTNMIQRDVSKHTGQLDEMQKQQAIDLQAKKDAREESRQQSDLTRDIFKEFVDAIKDRSATPDLQVDRLTGVLVLTDAIPSPIQREGMARAVAQAIARMRNADNGAATAKLDQASFDAEEAVVRASGAQRDAAPAASAAAGGGPVWSNYDFDIFWCDGGSTAAAHQAKAQEVALMRNLDPKAGGRWRVRALPAAVNARHGYQVKGYLIRYSSADEIPLANALKTQIEKKNPTVKVELHSSAQNTPWYLSVFVCD